MRRAYSGVSRHRVRQAVKEGMLTRRTPFIKPALTSENKLQIVEHALPFVGDRTLQFELMHDIVHVDEKWFYADPNRRSGLVFDGEERPTRVWTRKRFIPKAMFLAAIARPQ
ncbi:hypothetical protein PR003_g2145 [Phytophthora rubi]|uniref:Transposase Tc1-like domain-containing protein n=1 Tax=Phytophthora rubi TaxID=129364 RepID=A0A6A4G6F0_9STRA|nr:hypothetical protein PR003_g2145 [Phytophthora rubi]